ncbi:ROK family protein [Gramella sp. AN32]|uniref:ROK family protein n=1 Tax=Christiangramia antarctica TaxID=2058158 RepID=A0ABW5X1G5_9FLAO|nr:ROK family protein [Gramella sp. AN32]MCM4155745.1 sugar kinase [Gramella sp. AN32]
MSTIVLKEAYVSKLDNVGKKKYTQKIRIIKDLYVGGPKTNFEICKDFNISAPTCTGLMNELIDENLVEKKGRAKSEVGRQPDLFGLKTGSLYVLSIAVGKFNTKMAIFDNDNRNLTGIKTIPIPISKDLSAIDSIYKFAEELIEDSKIDRKKLMGIGINMPGLVDSEEGRNHTYFKTDPKSPPLQELLREKFGSPVFIQNDVKSAALAEYRFGLAQGKKDVLVISLDWGIGLGILMNGKLLTGTKGFAGEMGHIPLINEGALCYCGKQGCLETVGSGIALAKMAKEGLQSGQDSLLNQLSDQELDKIVPQLVIDAANKGDQYAINILYKTGLNLGKGIGILIQLLNPELIILGGKIAKAKEYITTPITQSINEYCMEQLREHAQVALSTLGEDVDILGSIAVVMENIFKEQTEIE